jgi:diguanylate cyclase (GGDEF)-like protein/PAS domain S-box-containing protein
MENLQIENTNYTPQIDLKGKILKVSKAFCEIAGYSKEELIGKKHSIIRHPDMDTKIYEELWDTIKNGQTWQGEIKNQRKDGSYYWVYSTISPVFDDQGDIIEYTAIRQDITDKKKVEELSITDQLTKLYNRVKLEEVFLNELQRANRYQNHFSMMILDIDYFKSVNDTYGHDIGDETLKDVAKILKNSVREIDTIGRWGGEEFIVITPETGIDECMILAQKIRKNIENYTFNVVGKKTSSFGVTEFIKGDTQESMVKRADTGLYKAKESGRNCVIKVEG